MGSYRTFDSLSEYTFMKKRDFLKLSGIITTGLMLSPEMACKTLHKTANTANPAWIDPLLALTGEFSVPALGYDFAALEPHIDALTMEIHHDKHHAAYLKKLNEGIKATPVFAHKTLGEILQMVTKDSPAIRNNAGGHYNHSLFWAILGANAGKPEGKLLEAINRDLGSYEKMLENLKDTGAKVFGSGWVWLCLDADKKLFISSTPNQDNPLMPNIVEKKGTPILAIDVWEHAYYLNYVNERKKYLDAIVNVLNWKAIGERYEYLR